MDAKAEQGTKNVNRDNHGLLVEWKSAHFTCICYLQKGNLGEKAEYILKEKGAQSQRIQVVESTHQKSSTLFHVYTNNCGGNVITRDYVLLFDIVACFV